MLRTHKTQRFDKRNSFGYRDYVLVSLLPFLVSGSYMLNLMGSKERSIPFGHPSSVRTSCLAPRQVYWDNYEIVDWCDNNQAALENWIPCEQLERVQTDSNIILVQTNCGYLDFAMNLWRAYERLGRRNILFLATDCQAYNMLSDLVGSVHVAKPLTSSARVAKGAQSFNSTKYRQFTAIRPMIMMYFLHRGFNILWQDVDSIAIKDPFQFLPPQIPDLDVVLTNDSSNGKNPRDKQMCSCFVYVMANRRGSMWFLERWQKHTMEGQGLNQPALNDALYDALDQDLYGSADFEHMILPVRMFPNGFTFPIYQSTAWWSHANWRVGKPAKLEYFRNYSLWKADDIICS